ncbi:MAG: ribonuclease HII [Bdellovibrionaceae bacterium]|nr:ribonuclease HII [Pseudobdellovibrionaceae bacterium]
MKNDLSLEPVDWKTLGTHVIGVDEVGRGCLAGPVYAAAVLFRIGDPLHAVTDSKKLTEAKRDELSAKVIATHHHSIAQASVDEIDEINILKASLLAMRRAVETLIAQLPEDEQRDVATWPIVIDGNMKIPGLQGFNQITLVKGDLRCAPVSAASIIAKVARDTMMKEQATQYPGYGFEAHKGYSTAVHKDALNRLGPCVIHRKTFGGVKELIRASESPASGFLV